jgi:hypothetical protein
MDSPAPQPPDYSKAHHLDYQRFYMTQKQAVTPVICINSSFFNYLPNAKLISISKTSGDLWKILWKILEECGTKWKNISTFAHDSVKVLETNL